MTAVSQIIIDAFRESNLVAITSAPTDLETAEAFRLLQRVVSAVYGFQCGELLRDFPVGNHDITTPPGFPNTWPDNAFFPLNVRVVFNLDPSETMTYYLHPQPEDGSRFAFVNANLDTTPVITLNGNGRKIDGVENLTIPFASVNMQEWIYDSLSATWKTVTPITLEGDMPFPSKYDDLFVIALSMRLNPRNGITMDPQSQLRFAQLMKQFKAQYHQVIPVGSEAALILTPGVRPQRGYQYDWWYGDPTGLFNAGYGYPGFWGA